ncbi:MAG: hypothetical protein ACOYXW_03315 [Actinomycetota bacterium]
MLSGAWCGAMGVGDWALMVGFWGAFLALTVWAVSRIFPRESPGVPAGPADEPTARELLDLRLASGEIDPETYQRLVRELHTSVP